MKYGKMRERPKVETLSHLKNKMVITYVDFKNAASAK